MTVERSQRRSYFLSLVFILTKSKLFFVINCTTHCVFELHKPTLESTKTEMQAHGAQPQLQRTLNPS